MSRAQLTVVAAAVVLAALVVGVLFRDRSVSTAEPSASPTSSAAGSAIASPSTTATAAVASPGASVSPAGAIYNDDFGFIVTEPGRAAMRKESSGAGIAAFTVPLRVVAVSPDGKRAAYWKNSSGLAGDTAQLRMFTTLGNATEETLVTLPAGQRGGGVAWSSDGAGLLYSTETGSFGVGPGDNSATLNLWELAAGGRRGTTIDTQTNTGWLYRPVAWDRSANLAAAGLTGEGGAMAFYVTVRINPDNTFNAQRVDTRRLQDLNGMPMSSIHASSDAKIVLGVEGESGSIRWWPLADFATSKSQAGVGKGGALWRPGTHEIGFMGPSDQFWLGDVDKAGSLGLCCTSFSGAPAGSILVTFRADGSAVVLAVRGTASEYTLVRLGTDPKSTTGDRVTFKDAGTLVASVRLR